MTDLSYTNKDGFTPVDGTTYLDWTDRNGVTDNPFNYHKDGKQDGDGYEHGGYPEITGETSEYPDTSYKTGDNVDFFDNGNVWEQPSVNPEPPVALVSIEITTPPTKVSYFEGEELDLTGLVVTAHYDDGTEKVVSATATPAAGTILTADVHEVILSFGGKETSQAISVEAIVLENIVVVTPPTKVVYDEGDALDLSGLVVKAVYNNHEEIINDYTTIPENGTVLSDESEVVISYQDKSVSQAITVIPEAELVSIEITTPPAKVAYYEGDALDLTGLVITAHYDDESSRILAESEYTTNPVDGAILADETEVVITYKDKSVSQAISVEALVLESINITIAPTKVDYFDGEALDLTGMVVNAIYNSGATPEITDYTTVPAAGTQLTTEDVKFTVSYEGKSAEQAISVEAVVLESINITKAPDKVDYFDGQSLDLTGMVVSAHYNNGHIEIVTDYTTVPAAGTQLTTEDVKFTVSYEGKSVEQAISVEAVVLENIEVTTPPTKTVYEIGDVLDLSGMVVTAHYNDGHDEVVNDYTTVPENGAQLTTDIYEVVITYQDKSTAQNIKVGASLTGIEVVLVDSLYNVGDPLRAPDHVLAEYEGGTKKEVFNYTVEPPVGTPVTIEMDEDSPIVTYVEGDESATAEMDIVVFE